MERAQLESLVRECDKPSAEQRSEAALTRWAQQRLKMPAWVGMTEAQKDRPEAEAIAPLPAADPVPEEPRTLADRAILKPERLSTPGRLRAAFRSHFARCGSTTEAAARTGISRRTVQRWRKKYPGFDGMCRDIVEARRQQAVENIVLAADRVETRPVFYRGKKIGEYARRDRALDLCLVKQADTQALREEKRRDAAATVAAEADFEARVATEVARVVEREVARRISEMSRSPRQEATPVDDEFINVANDFDASGRDIAFAP
ncbi:MAG: helix-turn-helix domain-containing protein [Rhodospirillaceae bacterium]|nr:helix-turn-helix domain-containing protein [Rhodospirillaceae bacterium]